jgi:hypothetical protein
MRGPDFLISCGPRISRSLSSGAHSRDPLAYRPQFLERPAPLIWDV